MNLTLTPHDLNAVQQMPPAQLDALLASARALQHAARAGLTQPLLKGKNIGLVCDDENSADAVLFQRAATELGAHVARIRTSASGLMSPQSLRFTTRMLGKLYDALECQGLPPALVQQVGDDAGVPVYDGIASPDHPTAKLADLLGSETTAADNRRFVLQAVLLSTLG